MTFPIELVPKYELNVIEVNITTAKKNIGIKGFWLFHSSSIY